MAKNKNSLKLPSYLKKIGFEVAESTESPQRQLEMQSPNWGRVLDPISRHPITLILLTSLLSVVLGSWLTAVYQERQREREATVRSMDEVRTTLDDVYLSFEQYESASTRLISLKEADAAPNQLKAAQNSYDEAGATWRHKIFGYEPDVMQRMPSKAGGAVMIMMLTEMVLGSYALDACIAAGKVENKPGNVISKSIVCNLHVKGRSEISADDRLARLTGCVQEFHLFARPDPKSDFDSASESDGKLGAVFIRVQKSCMNSI